MAKKKKVSRLYVKLLINFIIPLIILGIALLYFVYANITNMKYEEMKEKLRVVSGTFKYDFDRIYPGDMTMKDSDYKTVSKGDVILNGDHTLVDKYKELTDCDVTVFYGDMRIMTTLYQDDERVVLTRVNPLVKKQVLESGKDGFYKVNISGVDHIVYYACIVQDGKNIGLVGVSCPVAKMNDIYMKAIMPFIIFFVVLFVIIGWTVFKYSNGILREVGYIDSSLKKIGDGRFKGDLDGDLLSRKDEFGDIGKRIMSMRQELKILVENDKLTGAYNRSSGQKMYAELLDRVKKTGISFMVVLGDIDYFKKVNDTYGHNCGDMVLIECASIMKKNVGRKGFVCRWGGEEFLMVFSDTSKDDVMSTLEGIRRDLSGSELVYDDKNVCVTMTFGVVDGDVNETMEMAVKRADDKLYFGKNNGRNQIVY
jgi:diguanylate cyclase (GGDEF)-like protein